MISHITQSPAKPVKANRAASGAPRPLLPADLADALGTLVDRLRRQIAAIDRKQRLEFERRRAIAHLRSLTDAQLRDVGIARPDIERAVRHGKDAI
jgi:uncharacterized protein YjiS (DUF1127 family)